MLGPEAVGSPLPVQTAGGEVAIGYKEILFSRTDERGVIRSGNEVAPRVSGDDWSRPIGAPHRIVRTPITPRRLLHVRWGRLGAGLPTGAHAGNRTEDGRHYRAFAVVVPLEDGSLSNRIRPGTRLLGTARRLDGDAVAQEAAGPSPRAGATRLLRRLRAEGVPGCDAFQRRALALGARRRGRQIGLDLSGPDEALTCAEPADGIENVLALLRDMIDNPRLIALDLRVSPRSSSTSAAR